MNTFVVNQPNLKFVGTELITIKGDQLNFDAVTGKIAVYRAGNLVGTVTNQSQTVVNSLIKNKWISPVETTAAPAPAVNATTIVATPTPASVATPVTATATPVSSVPTPQEQENEPAASVATTASTETEKPRLLERIEDEIEEVITEAGEFVEEGIQDLKTDITSLGKSIEDIAKDVKSGVTKLDNLSRTKLLSLANDVYHLGLDTATSKKNIIASLKNVAL